MPDSEQVQELSAMLRAQTKTVRRAATIAVQLAARLEEAMGEDTNHSPEEDTDARDTRTD
jgi:hypothetical protein